MLEVLFLVALVPANEEENEKQEQEGAADAWERSEGAGTTEKGRKSLSKQNGSLSYRSYRGYNYDPAYTSHAHGWSSGPTPALTFYVLGLTVISPQGKTWSLAPHINGGLPGAEGGFETSLGWFGVAWTQPNGVQGPLIVKVTTPNTTSGFFKVPRGVGGKLTVDGVSKGSVKTGDQISLQGGTHNLVVQPSTG
ncbi:putative bacterial alpha-L-rhamnosidase 6 hairpin glycosidase domain [Lyophyllum shimeji]|uniref:Bacterial alpha-L-rhamnosidase 6 hairpin glycosidase domain n=1 Tax=Lyophyllum shimeji TaxID=47721 RepID=A0A9P3PWN8_LYOSH|nr:putative bacterial alpha-L-rhamnosidase 6 hairpin glycosidase domain [Lyophyllum shimeji]